MKAKSIAAIIIVLLVSGAGMSEMFYNFDDGTMQGWMELTVPDPSQTEGPRNWAISPPAHPGNTQSGSGAIGQNIVGGNQDFGHPTLLLRSPEFKLTGAGDLTVWLRGGDGYGADCTGKRVEDLPAYAFDDPGNFIFPSFLGVALRNVNTGIYDLAATRAGQGDPWQLVTISAAQLAALDQDTFYTLDLIDVREGGWGWVAMDTVTIPGRIARPVNPIPADGAVGVESGQVSWTAPPEYAGDFWVYASTDPDPNVLDESLVGVVAESEANLGAFPEYLGFLATWYWRVDVVEPNELDPENWAIIKGSVWSFTTLGAEPVISVHPPQVQFVDLGEEAEITIAAYSPSDEALSYQWYEAVSPDDSSPVAGATETTLSLAMTADVIGQRYFCRVTTDSGDVDSTSVELREKKLLAHWPLDNLEDPNSVVAGTPAVRIHGEPELVDGPVNGLKAMYFDGIADGLATVNTGDYFHEMYEFMTVSVWVKSDSLVAWRHMVSDRGDGSGWTLRHQGFAPGAGLVCFTTRGIGNDDTPASFDRVLDNNWRHLVATYDGSVKRLYVDGFLDAQVNASGTMSSTEVPIGIACRVWAGEQPEGFFNGALYDARLYNYPLSDVEVAELSAGVRPLCVTPLAGDLNDDCIVDLKDFAIMASEWLDCTSYPDCTDELE